VGLPYKVLAQVDKISTVIMRPSATAELLVVNVNTHHAMHQKGENKTLLIVMSKINNLFVRTATFH